MNNSVNFPDNPQPPQDYSENYPFSQQNKNKQQTPYNTNNLSTDDDDYYQPDIFAPYTKTKNATISTIPKYENFPTKSNRYNPQQIHIQNPFSTQSFQPIQLQNPITKHSYQPTQM